MTTTLEDRLRDAYQAAAQTVRPETIRPGVQYHRAPPARRPSRFQKRSAMFAPLAAAAAVVVAVGTALAVPLLAGGTSHHAPVTMSTPATAPFMVEVAGSGGSQLAIQQAGTKHLTGFISLPHGAYTWEAVAATGDTTFVAAAATFSDRDYTSALYRFTLSAEGKPSHLTTVRSGIQGEISGLAASQGGSRIAYTTPETSIGNLAVISGTSTRQWTAPALSGPGSTGLLSDSLSLTADGSELSFIIFRQADTAGGVRAAGTMWLLPVSSAPGSATARAHKVTTGPSDSAPNSAVLSADGRTLYVLSTPAPVPYAAPPGPESVTLSAYSTADGALLRIIHTWTGIPYAAQIEMAMTISGGELLVWGVGGTGAYQVDPASGVIKPVWVYSLHDKGLATPSSSIAW
jgi:hypothetical protein